MTARVLVPFDTKETISVADAAELAGVTAVTARQWAATHDLGRVIGGRWQVSRVAFTMFLEDDAKALRAYHAGDRESPVVVRYFERFGLTPQKI